MNIHQRNYQFAKALGIKPEFGTPEHTAWLQEIARKNFIQGDALDINALDPLDPVHAGRRYAEGHDEQAERIEREQDYEPGDFKA